MMTLEEISARLEIDQVLCRYARGVDRGDAGLIRSAYFDDAWDDHGPYQGDAAGLADLLIPQMDATGLIGQHLMVNSLVELDGPRANAETYWVVIHPEDHGLIQAGGRYLDRFECRDGQWRIADRKVLVDWSRDADNPPPWALAAHITPGQRREQDPSSGFFTKIP